MSLTVLHVALTVLYVALTVLYVALTVLYMALTSYMTLMSFDATKSIYFDALDLTKRFSREPFISFSLGEKAKRTSLGPYRRTMPMTLRKS